METMAAVEQRLFTVEEYQRMGETGILGEDDRVELIEGRIVRMTPIGIPHTGAVKELLGLFSELAGARAVLSVQDPVVLGELSEPQPDVVLLKPPRATYRRRHPRPEDVLLLIEVADTSAAYDRDVKAPLYARAGIPEYWIVDVGRDVIEVFRSSSGDRYASVEERRPGDRISPEALPEVELAVSEILGTD